MNRNRRLTRLRSLALAGASAGVLGVAAAPTTALATPTISISGATASYPLVSLLAAKYVKLKPHSVKFKITQGGAQIGINDVAASRVSIGDVSRDPLPTDPKGLVFYPIAKYGICVVTNSANTLSNLTPSLLVSIFTGKTRSWSQVPGATASGTIDLISRTSVAGVLTSFQTLLLEGKKVTEPLAHERPSEGLLRAEVESDPNAIGFLSNYQAGLGKLNTVAYNGDDLQPRDRAGRAVRRHRAVLRGHARSRAGLCGVVHLVDHEIGGGAQDHLQPVGAGEVRRLRSPWPDHRAERVLGAVSLLVGACVIAMIAFVGARAWPTFEHNGLSWLGPGGTLETQIANMQATSVNPPASAYHLNAWPLVYGTLLTTSIAIVLGTVIAVLSSIFIVELAPARLRKLAIPVIRLLASVPSVVYGLIGVLVLVPFVGNHLVTASEKNSVQDFVELTGAGLRVVVVILTVMITPIMIALICEALMAAPASWREGAVALGLNPLRAMLAVTLRAIRPAIVAAAVLATARALGEAVMIQMVSGGSSYTPNFSHGALIFFYEPLRTLASAIVDYHEGLGAPALRATLYAFGALLLFSRVRAVDRRLSDQAPIAQVSSARMSVYAPQLETSPPPTSKRGRRSSPWTWRWRDRLVLACAWTAGLGLCAIAAAIVLYMGWRGIAVPAPGAAVHAPGDRSVSESDRGHPRPPDRDGAADADRHRARVPAGRRLRGVDRRVRATALARARGRVEHRDRRRYARHRDRAVRPVDLPARPVRAAVVPRRRRRRVRALVHRGRRDDVADRAAAPVRRHARRAAGRPGTDARGVVRAGQDPDRDDPPRAAAERALEHRHRRDPRHESHHRRHGDRAAAAGRDAADRNAGSRAGREPAARYGLDADQLRL